MPPAAAWEFDAIGTHWRIDIFKQSGKTVPGRSGLAALRSAVDTRIEAFDRTYSRFRGDSLVSRMSRSAGSYDLPADAKPLMKLYEELYVLTGGLVTPLIGQVLSDAGYDAAYSLDRRELSVPPAWEDVLQYVEASAGRPDRLTLKRPALLDFGAAGKGYLVDLVADVLWRRGYRSYCVDAGGDLLHVAEDTAGIRPLRIGLEHPDDPGTVVGVADIMNTALCGSAGNRRAWKDLHHIMNPKSLEPVRDVLAVWTTAKTCLLADAMASCLFFVEAPLLQTRYSFEYVLLRPDYTYERSPGFPGELLTV